MIVGIGTDLIEIERIKKACEKEAFLVRVYTEEERRQENLYRNLHRRFRQVQKRERRQQKHLLRQCRAS